VPQRDPLAAPAEASAPRSVDSLTAPPVRPPAAG